MILKQNQKNLLYKILINLLQDFILSTESEKRIYKFIVDRTIRYGKYFEYISFENFMHGNLVYDSLGVNLSRTVFFKAMKSLIDSKIILKEKKEYHSNRILFAINIPKILGLITKLNKIYPELKYLKNDSEKYLQENRFNCSNLILKKEIIMKLDEAIKQGVDRYQKSAKKKKKRLETKREYTPAVINALMKSYCEEYGNRFFVRNTAKLRGQMRNWVKDCKDQGIDIKQRLRDICRLWQSFKLIKLNNVFIQFVPDAVSFEYYYKYQKYIDPFIEAYEPQNKQDDLIFIIRNGEDFDKVIRGEC